MKNTSLTQRPTTPTEPNWQPLNDFAEQKQNDSGLKAWLAVVEGCIRAIEKTAWQSFSFLDQMKILYTQVLTKFFIFVYFMFKI